MRRRSLPAALGLALLATTAGAALPGPAPADIDVRAELVGEARELRILRRAHLMVRVTNRSGETLPGCSAQDYAQGQPTLFLGAWIADRPADTLGTFETTQQLTTPLAPGESLEVPVVVRPAAAGARVLGLGLLRRSVHGNDYAQVGRPAFVPISVQPGAWHENRRGPLLKALVLLHLAVVVGALLALGWQQRAR